MKSKDMQFILTVLFFLEIFRLPDTREILCTVSFFSSMICIWRAR